MAVDDARTTAEDTALTVPAPGLLANDSDADGGSLTATKLADPQHGVVTVGTDGRFTYAPAPDYNGPDQFTYRVSDGTLTADATVRITVTAVNDAPTIVVRRGRSCASSDNGGTFDLVLADVDSTSGLTLAATSSNTRLVGAAATTFSGSGRLAARRSPWWPGDRDRTVTIRVSDGALARRRRSRSRRSVRATTRRGGSARSPARPERQYTARRRRRPDAPRGGNGDDRLDGGAEDDAVGGVAGNDWVTGGRVPTRPAAALGPTPPPT